ncbi:Hypothetical protein, putative [Bodo saltans]|uniref:Oxidation resistance protein 1 n=1 Tax=Bodo saltans TaxID=75058 RepID=A0A0S4J497_BODSA|nr:Hypothetical protein, putative [Bodo saltans]|eukprot:CUG14661.1 Hypothetical protein, putative [Bodo saltans]
MSSLSGNDIAGAAVSTNPTTRHADSSSSSASAARGVVDFLMVLEKLLRAIQHHHETTRTTGSEQPRLEVNHDASCDCPFADVRYAALWETVLGYQASLHGRSPGTLLTVNVALSFVHELPLPHLVELLCPSPAIMGSASKNESASQRRAHQLASFYGRLLSFKRQLLRIHLNVNLLRDWIQKCPTFYHDDQEDARERGGCIANLEAKGEDDTATTKRTPHDDREDWDDVSAPLTAQTSISSIDGGDSYSRSEDGHWVRRHRCMAFDVAVLVYSVSKGMRHVQGLLPSVASESAALHRSGYNADGSGPLDDGLDDTHPGVDMQRHGATSEGAPAVMRDSMTLMIAQNSLEECVTLLSQRSRHALLPLFGTIACQLLLSGDVPDAIGWLLCKDRLSPAATVDAPLGDACKSTPQDDRESDEGISSVPQRTSSHLSHSPRSEDDRANDSVLLSLCNRIRSCQSVEMLTDFILWIAVGCVGNETAAAAAADDHATNIISNKGEVGGLRPPAAAEYCIEQATEHCLALMISSQLILHECDGAERSRLERVDDVQGRTKQGIGSGTTQRCPMCHQQHASTAVCEGTRQRVALAITESLISSLVVFTEQLCSDNTTVTTREGKPLPPPNSIKALLLHYPAYTQQAALQMSVDLVVCSTTVCQRFQAEPLSSFPVFSRTYNTERQLLMQQQALSTAMTIEKSHHSSKKPSKSSGSGVAQPSSASMSHLDAQQGSSGAPTRKPSFVLRQDSSGFLIEDLTTTLTLRGGQHERTGSHDDVNTASSTPQKHLTPRSTGNFFGVEGGSATLLGSSYSLVSWENMFLPTHDEKEVEGMYVLCPPAFSSDDLDMLRSVAVDNGGDVLRFSSSATSSAAKAPVDAHRLFRVLTSLTSLMYRTDVPLLCGDAPVPQSSSTKPEESYRPVFSSILTLAQVADRLKQLCLAAISEPWILTEALTEMHSDDGSVSSRNLFEMWSNAASVVVRRSKHRRNNHSASTSVLASSTAALSATAATFASSIPTSLSATAHDEPMIYFSELCAAVEQAQELLALAGQTQPITPSSEAAGGSNSTTILVPNIANDPVKLVQVGLLVKAVLDRYRSSLYGRAPSTLQQLSLGCGIAARLLREGRRRALRLMAVSSTQTKAASSVVDQQQTLEYAETDLVNRAIAYQKRVLVLSQLEPATRCSDMHLAPRLCYSQSMWMSAAHQYAVAERMLSTRQDAVRLGFHRLKEILRNSGTLPAAVKKRHEVILRFQQGYGRVVTTPTYVPSSQTKYRSSKQSNSPNVSNPSTPTTSPTTEAPPITSAANYPFVVNDVLVRLRYNAAVSLWSGGHAEDAEAWLLSALGTSQPSTVLAAHLDDPQLPAPGQLIQLAVAVAHLCQLMQTIFSGDAVDGLLYFLGSLSSEVALNPNCIAGALVLTQNILERYLSLRVCRSMIASIGGKGGGGGGISVSSAVQTRHVAAICNLVVVQLSTGKIQDIQHVLRNGLPPMASQWDKLLVHAVVTCMNFCSAFPDSVWYEATFHKWIVNPPPPPPTPSSATVPSAEADAMAAFATRRPSVLEELSSPAPRPTPTAPNRSFWGTPREHDALTVSGVGSNANNNAGGGFFSRFSKSITGIFKGDDNNTAAPSSSRTSTPSSATTKPGTSSSAAPVVDAFHVVRVFFDKDMKRAPHLLAQLCEWAVATPLVVVREDDLRAVSLQLDEAMLELQGLLQQYGGDQEAAAYIAGLRANAEYSMQITEAFAPPAAGFDAAARLVEGGDEMANLSTEGIDNGSGAVTGYSFACAMSPAVAAPKPSFTAPSQNNAHVDPGATTTVETNSRANPSPESALSNSAVLSTTDVASAAPAYVPEVTLDKLGATSVAAVHAARRAHVLGSVYSPTIPGVVVSGVTGGGSCFSPIHPPEAMLTLGQLAALHQQLPMHIQLQPWRNVYSTRHHGCSFRTLLSNCEGEEPLLLVLEVQPHHTGEGGSSRPMTTTGSAEDLSSTTSATTTTTMIGAYLSSGIRMGHQKYFGGAETFVFQCKHNNNNNNSKRRRKLLPSATPSSNDEYVTVYRWSHQNDYFLNCRMDYMAIGGGAQGAAIYLDDSLSHASTSTCATFSSPPLVAPPSPGDGSVNPQSVSLTVLSVEVYAIGAAKRPTSSHR